jgi:hypothetical protein
MPRSKTPDGKRVGWTVKLTEAESAAADALIAEHGLSRSAWLGNLIRSALESRGGRTAAAPQRQARRPAGTAPVAAELARERARDQREDDCPHRKPPGAFCKLCA